MKMIRLILKRCRNKPHDEKAVSFFQASALAFIKCGEHRVQRTAALPLAKAGTICKPSNALTVVVSPSPPLPLDL
jgi:hypothetical protein